MAASRSGRISSSAAQVLDRVLARFTPIASWNVIGPFPRSLRDFSSASVQSTLAKPPSARRAARSPGQTSVATPLPAASTSTISSPATKPPIHPLRPKPRRPGWRVRIRRSQCRAQIPRCSLASSTGPLMITLNEEKICELAGAATHSEISDPEVVRAT